MNAPICDFVRDYAARQALRLHMPGHKGRGPLGVEALDITEIPGADSLYEASGVIRESEENASHLFGCPTLYSTEGSSLCIRAMLYLTLLHAKAQGRKPRIVAGRNAHKTFLSAAALLDLDVVWLNPAPGDSYLSCTVSADALDMVLDGMDAPAAVYLTSPDYLGNTVDIAAIAEVCHRRDVLLLVDNAHGAYLRFLPESRHPIDLGADICCDSAHKTLPVLTGGAYLHLSPAAPQLCFDQARTALALFGSTSPSYLILQSLDAANLTLGDGYRESLARFTAEVDALKARLVEKGWLLQGDEPLKLTLRAKHRGYTGAELAQALEQENIVCEFADPDLLVLMLTPEVGSDGLAKLEAALDALPKRTAIDAAPPAFHPAARALSIRDAALSPCETLPVERCLGRILAAATVGCPPAVPILVCGERIDAHTLACLRYYGIESCTVVRE